MKLLRRLKGILKQQYEKFTAPSSEMLDHTFDRLQKLVSQLELLGEKFSQEDVNKKLLSLSHEWNTHAVVWRNKADLDTMSMDDLYNNLKSYVELNNCHRGEILLESEELQEIKKLIEMDAQEGVCRGNIYFHSFGVMCALGGYDCRDQVEDGPKYSIMALSSSVPDQRHSNESICSKIVFRKLLNL
ncbi:hypothetical protein Tco_0038532 [Tanacetum coccineum]